VSENYPRAFEFKYAVDRNGEPLEVRLGRLGWYGQKAKLVVLDGQHRAMALLAINRTVNRLWDDVPKAHYRYFYEDVVRRLLREASDEGLALELEEIEFPVTICWFPKLHGEGKDPHQAARKLFVDINKNARAPSDSRLTLLSDTELLSVFTRSVLDRLRTEDAPLPLAAIEYDNPEKNTDSRPVRWTVLSTILTLKAIVRACVFGPKDLVEDPVTRISKPGRPSRERGNPFLQTQLDLKSVLPEEFLDGERRMRRADVNNWRFPIHDKRLKSELVKRFMGGWGEAILTFYAELLPYQSHIRALNMLSNSWATSGSSAELAKDALLEGTGMYWTLKDSNTYWEQQVKDGQASRAEMPEVVKAWREHLASDSARAKEFRENRAQAYEERARPKDVNDLFKVLETLACQLGAMLVVAQVALETGRDPAVASKALVRAWNVALKTGPARGRDRRYILSKTPPQRRAARGTSAPAWNLLGKMDKMHAKFFRYFWLELLLTPREARQAMAQEGFEIPEKVSNGLLAARYEYLKELTRIEAKAIRDQEPTLERKKLLRRAEKGAERKLEAAMKWWFGFRKSHFRAWLRSMRAGSAANDADMPLEAAEGDDEATELDVEELEVD